MLNDCAVVIHHTMLIRSAIVVLSLILTFFILLSSEVPLKIPNEHPLRINSAKLDEESALENNEQAFLAETEFSLRLGYLLSKIINRHPQYGKERQKERRQQFKVTFKKSFIRTRSGSLHELQVLATFLHIKTRRAL